MYVTWHVDSSFFWGGWLKTMQKLDDFERDPQSWRLTKSASLTMLTLNLCWWNMMTLCLHMSTMFHMLVHLASFEIMNSVYKPYSININGRGTPTFRPQTPWFTPWFLKQLLTRISGWVWWVIVPSEKKDKYNLRSQWSCQDVVFLTLRLVAICCDLLWCPIPAPWCWNI